MSNFIIILYIRNIPTYTLITHFNVNEQRRCQSKHVYFDNDATTTVPCSPVIGRLRGAR